VKKIEDTIEGKNVVDRVTLDKVTTREVLRKTKRRVTF
jgi:hypothetical protein